MSLNSTSSLWRLIGMTTQICNLLRSFPYIPHYLYRWQSSFWLFSTCFVARVRNELSIRADEQIALHHSFHRKRKTCFRFPAQDKYPSCAIQMSQTWKGPLVTAALNHLICLCTRFIAKKGSGCTKCPLQKLVVLLITLLIAQIFDPPMRGNGRIRRGC
jgi:hypothetical protein